MQENPYPMIFKRKSFRRFDDSLVMTDEELNTIQQALDTLVPLVNDIDVAFKIVPRQRTTSKRGEYCLLAYSEAKAHYLHNTGYMLEQLDLYLASKNIGACWYGMGKTDERSRRGLDFVIMMALGKSTEGGFRKDYRKSKRKALSVIWEGDLAEEIGDVARYAPSACNSQPWRVVCHHHDLRVFRTPNIRSIMPAAKVPFYNAIDMGVFLYILELCLSHGGYAFERTLVSEDHGAADLIPVATYSLEKL